MKAAAIVVIASGLLAACGGAASSGQPAGSTKVSMTEFKFDPNSITVPHGKVVFFLVNDGTAAHDMIVRDASGTRVAGSELVSAGDSFEFTIDDLAAGTYTFACSQPGHEAAGMKGTLTVT